MDQLNVLEDGKKDALNIDIRETKDEENQIEFGQKGYYDQQFKRILKAYRERLIEPSNKKMQYFNLIVSVTLFIDYFLTGLIMGNYAFYIGTNEYFKDHV